MTVSHVWEKRPILDPGLVLTWALALYAVWPLLPPGLPNTADGPIHFYRAVDLQQAWREGVFYPRWSANLALGYGTPLFNFAPPLLYMAMMALNTLGLGLAAAMKVVVMLFVFVGATGMYLLGRDTLGRSAGVIAAAAYLCAPYRLRELYIQGNYAQFLGLSLFPLILWCYFRVVETGWRRYVVGGGVAHALLLLSHNISAMIFTPLLVAYVLFWLALRPKWTAVRDAGVAGLLGLGLSAFFWLPAFYERRWIQLSQITKGHFDFRLHFLSLRELFAGYIPLDYSAVNVRFPLSLGLAAVGLAAVGLIAGVSIRCRVFTRAQRSFLLFSVLVLALCIFMMLPLSTPLWENAPLLSLAEFPWRLLGVAGVPLAILAGAAVNPLRAVVPGRARAAVAALMLVSILVPSFTYLFPRQPFPDFGRSQVGDIAAYELRTRAYGTTSAGEFLPVWTVHHPTDSPMVADYEAGGSVDKIDRTSLPEGVQVEELGRGYLWNSYRFRTDSPFAVRFNTLWFPGWQAYVDGEPAPSRASDPQGLIQVVVPAGSHVVLVKFTTTPVRVAAEVVSALTVLAGLALVLLRRPRSPGEAAVLLRGEPVRYPSPSVFWMGVAVIALLVLKEAVIGPHTGWFRANSPPGVVQGVQHPARIALGEDTAYFLGYDLGRDNIAPGDSLEVTVYWQAGPELKTDYRSFVHLGALSDWATVAQSDAMHPAGIPMTTWPKDFYGRDEHRLEIPADVQPGLYILRAGLYDPGSGKRLAVRDDERQEPPDALALQGIRITRAEPLQPHALPERPRYLFGGQIELLSYRLPEGEVRPGHPFEVALFWRARAPVSDDYVVFVHLSAADGDIIDQSDGPPAQGRYPTSYWLPDEIVEDVHRLQLPAGFEGTYHISVGLYHPETLERLPVQDAMGRPLPDGKVTLK
mgnify:CR=1 FL=1